MSNMNKKQKEQEPEYVLFKVKIKSHGGKRSNWLFDDLGDAEKVFESEKASGNNETVALVGEAKPKEVELDRYEAQT